jgi:Na+-transporting methylmalonyl-CoA/oxaloacetate decarboxylase gamma subunit
MTFDQEQQRIRKGILLFGVLLFAGLFALRLMGIERRLLIILGIASLILVLLLLITYRAFVSMAEEARKMPPPTESDKELP